MPSLKLWRKQARRRGRNALYVTLSRARMSASRRRVPMRSSPPALRASCPRSRILGNPQVAGQGHAKLRAAGIVVDVGMCAGEASRDHAGHFRRVRDGRPHVILKLAVSPDDKISAAGGKPVAITGEAARARVRICCVRAMRRGVDRHRHRAGGRSAADRAGCPAWQNVRRCASCWIVRCACRAIASWFIPRARCRCGS